MWVFPCWHAVYVISHWLHFWAWYKWWAWLIIFCFWQNDDILSRIMFKIFLINQRLPQLDWKHRPRQHALCTMAGKILKWRILADDSKRYIHGAFFSTAWPCLFGRWDNFYHSFTNQIDSPSLWIYHFLLLYNWTNHVYSFYFF